MNVFTHAGISVCQLGVNDALATCGDASAGFIFYDALESRTDAPFGVPGMALRVLKPGGVMAVGVRDVVRGSRYPAHCALAVNLHIAGFKYVGSIPVRRVCDSSDDEVEWSNQGFIVVFRKAGRLGEGGAIALSPAEQRMANTLVWHFNTRAKVPGRFVLPYGIVERLLSMYAVRENIVVDIDAHTGALLRVARDWGIPAIGFTDSAHTYAELVEELRQAPLPVLEGSKRAMPVQAKMF